MPSLTTSSVSKLYQDTRLRFLSNLCIQFIYFVSLFLTVQRLARDTNAPFENKVRAFCQRHHSPIHAASIVFGRDSLVGGCWDRGPVSDRAKQVGWDVLVKLLF
ncbi:hypothetical protein [Ruegeria sp. Alg231-54]|uniref:hypothetical protein n=1 Tax=Ruegeria sp. Alg231-54 TaxID=1922221 RepID=UPI001F1CDA65|nr:hypothetical protein [Ruegeria sp. Alg231-54]